MIESSSAAELYIYTDGASRGNPGEAGAGVVIMDDGGAVVRELRKYLGHTTNNVAEYEAFILGLTEAVRLGASKIHMRNDSELLTRQISGEYRVKDQKLKRLHAKAKRILNKFDAYEIRSLRRENNRVADRLANEAIEGARAKHNKGCTSE
jgi:ribonuclease HI